MDRYEQILKQIESLKAEAEEIKNKREAEIKKKKLQADRKAARFGLANEMVEYLSLFDGIVENEDDADNLVDYIINALEEVEKTIESIKTDDEIINAFIKTFIK